MQAEALLHLEARRVQEKAGRGRPASITAPV